MNNSKNKNGQYWSEHKLIFTEKKWYEHTKEYLKILLSETPTFIALIVSIWAFTEILMDIAGDRISTYRLFIFTALIALVFISYKSTSRFLNKFPETIKNESEASKKIVWWQKSGWQCNLTRQILSERFESIEITLQRISSGAHYLPPKIIPFEDYIEWLKSRVTVLERLINAVTIQCTQELPGVLGQIRNETDLKILLQSIDNLEVLYRTAKDFEVESHQIIPPVQFKAVHEMTFGWSNPIRSGINELLLILKQIVDYDYKSPQNAEEVLSFNIIFKAPENVEEFCKRLDSIDLNNH